MKPVTIKSTDEQVMREVQEGQLNALSILFDRYQIPLYNFFYRQNYDGSLSEDLVQTVFERILKYRHSYDVNSTFRSWIYQIARNAKNDYYKSQKRISDFIQPENLEMAIDSIENDLQQREDLQQLERAMAQLSNPEREVLILTRFQKIKYQEVANILHCSEGAVKVKVHRALKNLRNHFFDLE